MAYTLFDRAIAWRRFRAALPHIGSRSRVCDIGCGLDARFLRYASARIVFGVGLDYQSIGHTPQAPAMIRCDITKGIPLQSGQFDHAVMLAVLEHLEQPRILLDDVFRILAPGGSLIMTWPQAIIDPVLNFLHGAGLVSMEMESGKHQPRIPLDDVMATIRAIGFTEIRHWRFEFGLNNLLVARRRD